MLDRREPAKYVSIRYPDRNIDVRFHRHTENNSIWIAGTDACALVGLTNVSYTAKKLDTSKVNKHRARTPTGFQEIIWFEASAVAELARQECRLDVITWLRLVCACLPGNETDHCFKDPVIIERSTLKKLMEALSEIEIQLN